MGLAGTLQLGDALGLERLGDVRPVVGVGLVEAGCAFNGHRSELRAS
jgi:hypothetical protein